MTEVETPPGTDDTEILVCSECRRAICWYGEGYCEDSLGAGTEWVRIGQLRAEGREHPEQWSEAKLRAIYGGVIPRRPTS